MIAFNWIRRSGYCLLFIPLLALMFWHAWFYRWLCDDAFITFRYARNLIEGHGLVFNRGEHVEGYTNFLWLLELAFLWRIIGMWPETGAHLLTAAFTIGTVAVVVLLARQLVVQFRALAAWIALALLAANRSFAMWSTSGLETRQFTFFILLSVLLLAGRNPSVLRMLCASVSLTLAEYTRPDGLLIAGCCFLWLLFEAYRQSFRRPIFLLAALTMPFTIAVAGHYLWRHYYYGEWFPNTYYAKCVRPWWDAGARYYYAAFLEYGMILTLPLTLWGWWISWRKTRSSIPLLFTMLTGSHMVYIMRVGGDHFEFRPLDFFWPLLACGFASGVIHLCNRRRDSADGIDSRFVARPVLLILTLCLGVFCTALLPAGRHWISLVQNPNNPKMDRKNYPLCRLAPKFIRRQLNTQLLFLHEHIIGVPLEIHRRLASDLQIKWSPARQPLGGTVFPAEATAARGTLGVVPFYLHDLRFIDMCGLTDHFVARVPVKSSNDDRRMAHDRQAPRPYLAKRGLNTWIHNCSRSAQEALKHADYAMKVNPDVWLSIDFASGKWIANSFHSNQLVSCKVIKDLGSFDDGTLTAPGAGDGTNNQPMLWRASGDAMTSQPLPGTHDLPLEEDYLGKGLLSSWADGKPASTRGEARSPDFWADRPSSLRFLIGGGISPKLGVMLLAEGKAVKIWQSPKQGIILNPVIFPLPPELLNKRLALRVFDYETVGEYAFILADNFALIDPGLP